MKTINTYKTKTILAAMLLIASVASAQDFSYSVKGNATETVVWINQLFGDIRIEGISGSEIQIQASDYEGLPEKAKGLKPLSGGEPENTGIGLSVTQEGNTISIAGAHREADDAEYTISLPKNVMLKIDYNSWQADDVKVVGMENEIEAKSQVGDLTFVDVTGPIVAHTLSSDLEVVFSSVNQASPSSITSTSGDIDVTLPSETKGTFKMATVSGGIYTDLDFDLGEDANKRRIMGQSVTGRLSGGGVEVSLKTVSGDIYVRKAN
ncbi:MAG: DUF4097 family beta strand repeat-containing protein [Cyclobacteriaceae bacterium]